MCMLYNYVRWTCADNMGCVYACVWWWWEVGCYCALYDCVHACLYNCTANKECVSDSCCIAPLLLQRDQLLQITLRSL